jgi:hypothetical protein
MASKIVATRSFGELRKGVCCPECDRPVKINRKKINHCMMQYLVELYKRHKDDGWVQASRVRIKATPKPGDEIREVQTGDYKMLVTWGLAEEHPEQQGFVRMTDLGLSFICGTATVSEAAFMENYRNRLIQFDGPQVSFADAYKTPFVLSEL